MPVPGELVLENGLYVQGVSKRFGAHEILKNVSLEAPAGRLTALIGQNGAGKSTLFRILMGLIPADEGSAQVNGRDVLSVPLHGKGDCGLGYLPQECASFPGLTVSENLWALLELIAMEREERKRRHEELLGLTGLTSVADREFRWLSGGEQRRLEIAKTLVRQPAIVLLDEPFSGLDPGIVEEIIEMMKALSSRGVGFLLTDHNVHMTLPAVEHAYLLAAGEILCEGRPDELKGNEQARKAYFGRTMTW